MIFVYNKLFTVKCMNEELRNKNNNTYFNAFNANIYTYVLILHIWIIINHHPRTSIDNPITPPTTSNPASIRRRYQSTKIVRWQLFISDSKPKTKGFQKSSFVHVKMHCISISLAKNYHINTHLRIFNSIKK